MPKKKPNRKNSEQGKGKLKASLKIPALRQTDRDMAHGMIDLSLGSCGTQGNRLVLVTEFGEETKGIAREAAEGGGDVFGFELPQAVESSITERSEVLGSVQGKRV